MGRRMSLFFWGLAMDKVLVFIDDGFLSKLSKFFGDGRHLKLYRKKFAEFVSKREGFKCEKIFVYTAAPFQSANPNKSEIKRKEGYDVFKNSLVKEGVVFREGRCQRLKINGNFVYKQKAVDILLAMDLMNVYVEYPGVKRIILISSDSDFIPVIKDLEKKGVRVVLYTYFDKKRDTNFSRSNDLIKSVHKYVKLTKEDFYE
jgi:uncharacterized LabA/DUF88 family protein